MRRALLLVALLSLPACDATSAGARAYRAGRFADAHAEFRRAADAAGASASPELLYDRALAALRAGDFADADTSASQAAARGGPRFAALRDFVRGNVAFARCEEAERDTKSPDAKMRAIAQAENARVAWQAAAMSRDDWPEARRNVERALRKLETLSEKKSRPGGDPRSVAVPRPKPEDDPGAPPEPPPPRPDAKPDPSADKPDAKPEAPAAALSREEVLRILDRLAERDAEKLALRRARRDAGAAEVERDW